MSKYIIEIKPEYEDSFKGVMILGARDSNLFVDVVELDNLEELNSDYINEHFGDLQDDAYQRGLDDGRNETWEAARKIVCDEGFERSTLLHIFKTAALDTIFGDFSSSEVIAKLKAYEEKQKADDEIMVGDEVINILTKTKGILLEPETEHLLATVIIPSQRWRTFNASHVNLKKTGKHYDIKKLLEAMKA